MRDGDRLPTTHDDRVYSSWSEERLMEEYQTLAVRLADLWVMDEEIEDTKLEREIGHLFSELAYREEQGRE